MDTTQSLLWANTSVSAIVVTYDGYVTHSNAALSCGIQGEIPRTVIIVWASGPNFRVLEMSGFIGTGCVYIGCMTDETPNGKSQDVSVRFPKSFLESELLPAYPAATSVSDAIRMAVQNDVQRKQEAVTPATVRDSVVEALETAGGTWESNQKLKINSVEDLDIEQADSVSVNNED